MEGYTIGALAEAAGVSVETVRFYQRRELIPEPERVDGRYRRYGDDDLDRLRHIRRAKELGFTLAEIAELLEAATSGAPEAVLRATRARLASLDEEAARIDDQRRRLRLLARACDDGTGDCLALDAG